MEHVQIVTITPEIATKLLVFNTSNRPVRSSAVARFKTVLPGGRHLLAPDCVAMTGSMASPGEIINGQHRLIAIRETGIPARMIVYTGCAPEVFLICDRGSKRSVADAIRRMGIANSSQVAAVATILMAYQKGSDSRSRGFARADSDEVAEFIVARPEVPDLVSKWLSLRALTRQPAAVMAAAVLHSMTDAPDAEVFWSSVLNGEMLAPHSPALTLRNRLLFNKSNKDITLPELVILGLCVKAVRAHIERRTLGVLKLLDTEATPTIPNCPLNPVHDTEA